MPSLFYPPHAYIPSGAGFPQAGALLYFYATGTSTPKNTYSDFLLSVANANPVVADANGVWPAIYLADDINYRITAKTALGALIYTQDDVPGGSNATTPQEFGAKGDGIADDTAGIQAALDTGRPIYFPAGTYNISDMISLKTPYQRLYGDGQKSIIFATSNFNLSRNGVFVASTGLIGVPDGGPWFQDFRVMCDQSVVASSGIRANLIQYPAAFYMRNAPRTRWLNVTIEQFLIGIDVQGLSAGCSIDNMEMGCYVLGFVINGSGDTTRLRSFRYIPFNHWTANQRLIYADGGNTFIATGRCDGLSMSDCMCTTGQPLGGTGTITGINSFLSTGVNFPGTIAGAGLLTGFTTGYLVNCGFDSNCKLIQNSVGGWLLVTNSYWSGYAGFGSTNFINLTAGALTISNCYISCSALTPATDPLITLNNASGQQIQLQIDNCRWPLPDATLGGYTIMTATGANPSDVIMRGNTFIIPNGNYNSIPLFDVSGAGPLLTFANNRFNLNNVGGMGQIAVSLSNDLQHVIEGNQFNGWTVSLPPNTPIASASQTVANPGVFTTAAQTWIAGQRVYITGIAPGGFTLGTVYYVIAGGLSATSAELAATLGGAGIQCTASAVCNLVPLSATNVVNTISSHNGVRGIINHNNANIRALSGNAGTATVAAASTVYLGPGGYANAAVSVNTFHMPKAGNIVGFQIKTNGGAVGAQTFTYTVYQNGAATAMTGSITAGQTVLNVTTNFFAVAAADRIELQLVTSATAAATNHTFSILFEPA